MFPAKDTGHTGPQEGPEGKEAGLLRVRERNGRGEQKVTGFKKAGGLTQVGRSWRPPTGAWGHWEVSGRS